jgi:general secretion pathway protein K
MLQEDIRMNDDVDDYEETQLRAKGLTVPVDGGKLSGIIEDYNRCFNINTLITFEEESFVRSEEDERILQRLIRLLNENPPEPEEVTLDPEETEQVALPGAVPAKEWYPVPTGVVYKISDWIDSDIDPYIGTEGEGAEDMTYTRLDPPYVTANNSMTSITELLLIDTLYDADTRSIIYRQLQPYLCALPDAKSKINVNTAPVHLIAALEEGMSLADAETLVARARSDPFTNADDFVTEFMKFFPQKEDTPQEAERIEAIKSRISERVGVATRFFLAKIDAEIYDARSRVWSLIHRTEKGEITVVARGQGVI